jgi:hypothetical protein
MMPVDVLSMDVQGWFTTMLRTDFRIFNTDGACVTSTPAGTSDKATLEDETAVATVVVAFEDVINIALSGTEPLLALLSLHPADKNSAPPIR